MSVMAQQAQAWGSAHEVLGCCLLWFFCRLDQLWGGSCSLEEPFHLSALPSVPGDGAEMGSVLRSNQAISCPSCADEV